MPSGKGYGLRMASPSCEDEHEVELRRKARSEVEYWIDVANTLIVSDGAIEVPDISFDLRGRAAGMAVFSRAGSRRDRALIRINALLLRTYPKEILEQVIAHEVAHIVTRWAWSHRTAPHGHEWQSVMRAFGKPPTRCHSMQTTPSRKTRRYVYRCGCEQPVYVGPVRHRRAQQEGKHYRCRRCTQRIVYTGKMAADENGDYG